MPGDAFTNILTSSRQRDNKSYNNEEFRGNSVLYLLLLLVRLGIFLSGTGGVVIVFRCLSRNGQSYFVQGVLNRSKRNGIIPLEYP